MNHDKKELVEIRAKFDEILGIFSVLMQTKGIDPLKYCSLVKLIQDAREELDFMLCEMECFPDEQGGDS